jgi:hypothetical protein
MATAPASVYSIVSWVRRGLGSLVSGQPTTNHASLPVSLSVNGTAVNVPAARLLGPGDITGLDARAVIRTDPQDGTDAFEPNYLAIAELALPDLPWMFTPGAASNGRLQPWICLVVVPDGAGASIEAQANGTSVLRLDAPLDPRTELPDLATIDMWAHAQVTGQSLAGAALNAAFDGNPSATLARLIAPRRLEAGQGYIACIVPTYRAGVNAALGLPVDPSDLAPAWDAKVTAPFVLPVYYHFRFRTGQGGDFASLAEKIGPPTVPISAGTRTVDVSHPGFGMAPVQGGTATAPATIAMGGALRTLAAQLAGTPPPTATQLAYAKALRVALTPPVPAPGADPVLGPPVYGSSASGSALPADGAPPLWIDDLNLDPGARLAASAGTQVIQKNRDALVAASWEQIGDLPKANRALRHGQLARQVSASLGSRHLQGVNGDGVFLQMMAPMHNRVSLAPKTTLGANVRSSRLPSAAVSAAMRTVTRPHGPLGRQVKTGASQIVERLNLPAGSAASALQVAAQVQPQGGMVSFDAVGAGTKNSHTGGGLPPTMSMMQVPPAGAGFAPPPSEQSMLATPQLVPGSPSPTIDWSQNPNLPPILKNPNPHMPAPMVFPIAAQDLATLQAEFRSAATSTNNYLQVRPAAPPELSPLGGTGASPLAAVRTQIQTRVDPNATIPARLAPMVPLSTTSDSLQPAKTGPQFPAPPMYSALADLSPEWMLPGISSIPIDCATLLEPNAPFIESFMVGLNEELSRELLWRQYPVNPRSTYFQNFWGASTVDIPAIQTFNPSGHLGSHVTNRTSGNSSVLLIRANLFRRYPNAVVSAVQAQWVADPNGTGKIRTLTATRSYPIFRGSIGDDVNFFGFALSDPLGSPDPAANRPGWYFVIEEHLTEPRFGLEPARPPQPQTPPAWNDLSWPDLPAGNFLNPATTLAEREGVTWGANAASMAFILLREPVRVALHALALLGPQTNGTAHS